MARKAREKSKTGKYIVMLKGIEDTIFKSKKTQEIFKELIEETFEKRCMGIRFFNDRVVMFLEESDAGIGMDMKPVLISFARTINRNAQVKGKVFADRFKSIPVEDKTTEEETVAYINRESSKDPFAQKRNVAASSKPKTVTKKATSISDSVKPKSKVTPKHKTETKPKTEDIPKKEEPKKRNNLPTWLL